MSPPSPTGAGPPRPAISAAPSSSGSTATGAAAPRASSALLLDGVQNPFNLGAILRTAAAFSVDHLWLVGAPSPTDAKVQKTALGSQRFCTWTDHETSTDAAAAARAAGYRIIGVELADGASPLARARPPRGGVPGHRSRGPRPLEGAPPGVRRAGLHPPAGPHRLAQRGHRHRHRLLRGPPHRLDPPPDVAVAADRDGTSSEAEGVDLEAKPSRRSGDGGHGRTERGVVGRPQQPAPVGRAQHLDARRGPEGRDPGRGRRARHHGHGGGRRVARAHAGGRPRRPRRGRGRRAARPGRPRAEADGSGAGGGRRRPDHPRRRAARTSSPSDSSAARYRGANSSWSRSRNATTSASVDLVQGGLGSDDDTGAGAARALVDVGGHLGDRLAHQRLELLAHPAHPGPQVLHLRARRSGCTRRAGPCRTGGTTACPLRPATTAA